ncbi:FHA domain-containing protein [Actinacidiphila glaucinigra]|uniref:FHA domain-containing protein n=1 Tax=Actinacidiphila glaucinigra TaxID=235986 RepID=UPI0036F189B2
MSTCPNGHQSATDDWCEVCGMRMSAPPSPSVPASPSPPSTYAAPGPPPPPPPYSGGYSPGYSPGYESAYDPAYDPGYGRGQGGFGYDPDATAAAEPCPDCGTPREGYAQFCEECRYDFVTQAGTTFVPPARPSSPGYPPDGPPYQRYESQLSRPSQINRPAEPLAPESVTSGSGDFLLTPPSLPDPGAGQAGPRTWTAVIAADREYFTGMMARSGPEARGLYFPSYSPEQRMPLAGPQVTVGRRRNSTGVAPDIDLSRAPEDPGVSHKHAVLVEQPDGSWSVVDQGSTNGTTVNGGEEPIDPFVPVPLTDGDRVHVGAWTTITIVRD